MELQGFTGSPEALFFDPFDSFEAVEKASAALAEVNQVHPELVRMQAGIDDTLASQRAILAVHRDSLGNADVTLATINLATARFLRMLMVRTNPGEAPPALESGLGPAIVTR
jgi:hypothetical protein